MSSHPDYTVFAIDFPRATFATKAAVATWLAAGGYRDCLLTEKANGDFTVRSKDDADAELPANTVTITSPDGAVLHVAPPAAEVAAEKTDAPAIPTATTEATAPHATVRPAPGGAPAQKSDAARKEELLPEVADLVSAGRVGLPAGELLTACVRFFRRHREPVMAHDFADLLHAAPGDIASRRDELLQRGLIDQIRVGTLGAVGYRPAPQLWAARVPATTEKREEAYAATKLDGLSLPVARKAAQPVHALDAKLFAGLLGVRRT